MRIINVCGARPNFMKIAPLMDAYKAHPQIEPILVHTGQHYDKVMSELFFDELGIPSPDINLEVRSGSHAVQTAEIMVRFEAFVLEVKPDLVLVVGDVNSTVACALVACKLGIRVAHVEAGLRSFDESMPEEINRKMTDAISDLLFVTEPSAVINLSREGVPPDRIHFVGEVMIDTLQKHLERARRSRILSDLGVRPQGYAVLTLHRPSNVDEVAVLSRLIEAMDPVLGDMPIIFPCHPRTRVRIDHARLGEYLAARKNLRVIGPLGYLDFLCLMASARLMLTDSGGIQEETTVLRVPCLTLRENTERPISCSIGSNQLVGTDPQRIRAAYEKVTSRDLVCDTPPLWDGKAAERIVDILARPPHE